MSLNMNPENRNNRHAIPRSCSFCRRSGHNILNCNDAQLRNFEIMCLDNISNITSRTNGESQFRNFLLSEYLYYPNFVKSFAIRYCRAPSRSNVDVYIDHIIQYFREVIQYRISQLPIIEINLIQSPNRNAEVNQQIETLPTQQANRIEEQPPWTYLQNFTNNLATNTQENPITLMAHGLLFMDMILSIREINTNFNTNINRKFDIKMNKYECSEKLVEICECNICYEQYENKKFINFDCGHKFCKDCVKKSLQNERKQNYCCAFCRKEIKEFKYSEENIRNEFDGLIV